MEEATGISEETRRFFFHKFIKCGGSILFNKLVEAASEIEDSMCECDPAGYPSCIGSIDATHIIIDKCYKDLNKNHLSPRMSTVNSLRLLYGRRNLRPNLIAFLLPTENNLPLVFSTYSPYQVGSLDFDGMFSR